jgi:hypothetical protein
MGGKVTKPKITVTETSGFKEEDHSWSIVNIHLACAVNTVLSLCGNLCHLRHSLRHTAARAEILQKETREERKATRDLYAAIPQPDADVQHKSI